MTGASIRYQALQNRLNDLKKRLLSFLPPPPNSKINYTDQELDWTRSYVVLVHAEIEMFCEDIALTRAQLAKEEFNKRQKVTPVLRKLVTYYVSRQRESWRETISPSTALVESAFASYKGEIDSNHGVKEKNLKILFHPLGIMDIDAAWLAAMNSFGAKRGELAHKGIKAHSQLDAHSELQRVERHLLPGLLKIDRKMVALK
jgi:RiboL-PSP-HEPN